MNNIQKQTLIYVINTCRFMILLNQECGDFEAERHYLREYRKALRLVTEMNRTGNVIEFPKVA